MKRKQIPAKNQKSISVKLCSPTPCPDLPNRLLQIYEIAIKRQKEREQS